MAKLKLDLHDIFNKGRTIEAELNRVIHRAVEEKIALAKISDESLSTYAT